MAIGLARPRAALVASVLVAGCSFDPAGLQSPDDDPADAAVAGDAAPPDAAPDDGDGPAPAVRFRRPITVPAARLTATVTDFPLFVTVTDPALGAHAATSGADLHFVAADGGTPLDHELAAWDPQTGALAAWVRVPALSAAADTTIYLRYGAFDDPPAPDPVGVWRNGFVAVWHLDQAPTGSDDDVPDALDGHDATSAGMDAGNLVDGVLGRGVRFDGGADQLSFDGALIGASAHTVSAWVNQAAVDHNSALLVVGNGACGQSRWLHSRFDGGPAAAGFYCDDWTSTGVDLQDQGWALVHWTYSAQAESRLYRDGAAAATPFTHDGDQVTAGAVGSIGNAPAAFGQNMGLEGVLDEVRIASVVRDAAWIAAEHANQRAPQDFYLIGAEEPLP